MKVLKYLAVTVALSLLGIQSVNARDRVNVGVNINAYDYVTPQISHYPNTVYYGRTPTVIYYGAPNVVQYMPIINTQSGYYQQQGHDVHRNYYRDWNQGFRQYGGRNDDQRNCNNRGRSQRFYLGRD